MDFLQYRLGFCCPFCSVTLFLHPAVSCRSARIRTIFRVRSRCGKGAAAVLANTFPVSAFCRFLPIKLCSTIWAAEQSVGTLGFKFFAAAFTGQLERLTNGVFAGFDFLIAFPALDAVSAKLLLPLGFLCGQLRFRQFKAPDEFQINLYFLHPIPVNLFRGVDDDLINKLVYHRRGQLRKVGVLLRQRKKLLRTVSIFLEAGQPLLRFSRRSDKGFLLRFIFRKQAVKAFIGDPPNGKGFIELFNDVVQLGDTLTVWTYVNTLDTKS